MTSDVIDTARGTGQAGSMTNIGQVVQVVHVEPLVLGDELVEALEAPVERASAVEHPVAT